MFHLFYMIIFICSLFKRLKILILNKDPYNEIKIAKEIALLISESNLSLEDKKKKKETRTFFNVISKK